jgi:hypothetical protein
MVIMIYFRTKIKAHVHWWSFYVKTCRDIAFLTSLGHLGRCDTKKKWSYLCLATQGGQGKNNGDVTYSCRWHYRGCYCTKLHQCKHGFDRFECYRCLYSVWLLRLKFSKLNTVFFISKYRENLDWLSFIACLRMDFVHTTLIIFFLKLPQLL